MTDEQDTRGPALLELHGPAFLGDPHATLRACAQRHWYADTAMGLDTALAAGRPSPFSEKRRN